MKIILFANSYETFQWHRIHLAREIANKNSLTVILPDSDSVYREAIDAEFNVKNLKLDRKGTNILSELKCLWSLYKILRNERADFIHNFTIKCVLYGSLVAKFLNIKVVNSITGLGYVFIDTSLKVKILRVFIKLFYKYSLYKTKVIFQNPFDYQTFFEMGVVNSHNSIVIPGSGVDIDRYRGSSHEPSDFEDIKFLFIGRLLKDKGVLEIIEACEYLKDEGVNFSFAGEIDEGNPNSISLKDLDELKKYANYVGFVQDSKELIMKSDVIVLPSYREGLSKTILEGMAAKKAIIATDVPGCKELVRHRENGLLIKSRSTQSLIEAIKELKSSPKLVSDYGKKSYEMSLQYDIKEINQSITSFYK